MFENAIAKVRSLTAGVTKSPERAFWWFIGLHLFLWTIIPTITCGNAPLDVIEGYAWGHEWVMGTYKHPPLQAWILESLAVATGRAPWAHFLASQIAVVTAFWAVWQTGRRMMGETQALIGVLLLEGVIYYNVTSTEFNPNVLQLTFWALAGWSFHRAVTENKLLDWALLGLWAAGGLYTKYSSILLLAVFAALAVSRPEARRCLKKPGPYLALLITVVLMLPHLAWLRDNHFLPFTYAKDRLEEAGPATHYLKPPSAFPSFLLSPIVFIVGQLLALLPAAFLMLVLESGDKNRESASVSKFDRAFLAASTFAPIGITLIIAIVCGYKIHDMWGAPFFNFAGLWAIAAFYPAGVRLRPRFAAAWMLIFATGLFCTIIHNSLSPYIMARATRVTFPGAPLALQVSEDWHKAYNCPLDYVVGDTWPGGNVAYYAPDRPHLFINANAAISPWIDMDDLKKKGGVVVWCEAHCSRDPEGHSFDRAQPAWLNGSFPKAEIQKSLELPRLTGADLFPVTIGWAIIPPQTQASP